MMHYTFLFLYSLFIYIRLFNMASSEIPHPSENWHVFEERVNQANDSNPKVWNPISRSLHGWIRMSKLSKKYNPNPGLCVIS
jgi:hypothetical protein